MSRMRLFCFAVFKISVNLLKAKGLENHSHCSDKNTIKVTQK